MASGLLTIEAPAVVAPRGGLLTVADVIDSSDPHVANGVEYQSFLCSAAGVAPGLCQVAEGVTVDEFKEFSGSDVVSGDPFAVYAGVECDMFGEPYSDKARDRLSGGEDFAVSRAFYETVLSRSDAVELADQPSMAGVIGSLEQYAAEHYAGLPVLHMNRFVTAICLAQDILVPGLDWTITTKQGTPVANAGGYPDDVVWVTGQVHLWRTPVNVIEVPDLLKNRSMALAERVYVATTDCILAWADCSEEEES